MPITSAIQWSRLFRLCLLGVLCTAILVLSGCGKEPVPEPPPAPTSTPQHIATKEQQAYLYCIKNGHIIQFKYDSIENKNILYCTFLEEGTRCDAFDYQSGTCSPTSTVAVAEEQADIERITCQSLNKPVCGEDGYTYSNLCVAELQEVKILHDGPCDIVITKDQASAAPTPDAGTALTRVKVNKRAEAQKRADELAAKKRAEEAARKAREAQVQPRNGTQNPDTAPPPAVTTLSSEWLDALINLSDSVDQSRKLYIEKCQYPEAVVYYQGEDCRDCFTTLYDQNGSILCHPSNDFVNACPAFFNVNNRASACRIIWKK